MILKVTKQKDYELIDSGNGEKLERYGQYVLCRPDPKSLWKKNKEEKVWENADFKFIREREKTKWVTKNKVPKSWKIEFGGLNFFIRPTSFKHTGIFPEHLSNWKWIDEIIQKNKKSYDRPIQVLNLFAYTGGATLASSKAGAEVCHVDGSKTAVTWARENAEISGLSKNVIRWIVEDVLVFLKREAKRGRKYDAIIMDPPAFGRGPKDELWKLEEGFQELMSLCKEILSDKPLFIIINGYTAGYSPIAYENILKDLMKEFEGKIDIGELTIEESDNDRLLPCGIFARWEKK